MFFYLFYLIDNVIYMVWNVDPLLMCL